MFSSNKQTSMHIHFLFAFWAHIIVFFDHFTAIRYTVNATVKDPSFSVDETKSFFVNKNSLKIMLYRPNTVKIFS